MRGKGELVGAVDFGSRQIRAIIARKDQDGVIHILGHGAELTRGCVSQGVIQDVNATQAAFKRALDAAEKEARVRVDSLFCAVNGKNVETFIREGNVKLAQEIVKRNHMSEARNIASHDILAPGTSVSTSVTSQEWYVDNLRVADPVGIRGRVLRTRAHFARIPTVVEDNLLSCIESQGRTLEDFIFTPLASALGCLTPEEMELGSAALDMGRGTTGVAVYRDYRILGTQSFEWGGFYLTRDVAGCLHVTFDEADELIMTYGIAPHLLGAEDGERVLSDGSPDQSGDVEDRDAAIKLKTAAHGSPSIVKRSYVEQVIYERATELLDKVRAHLQSRSLMRALVCGVVFTGGASTIKNHVELAAKVLQVSCRAGLPDAIGVLPHDVQSPEYSAVAGVIRHAFEYRAAARSGRVTPNGPAMPSLIQRIWKVAQQYYF